MQDTEQSKLLHQYYQAILYLQDEQDIIDALPNTDYVSFDYIINGLIELINKETEKTINLINHEFNPEMKEYMQEELNTLLFKRRECEKLIEKAKEIKQTEELAQITQNRNIIFASTPAGNIYLKEDLKEIAEEYYQDIANCLNQLETEPDLKKIERQFTNHAKLSKIHELRPFKIRVCYKMLGPDLVYVIIAKYKKSDNDRIETEKVIERCKQTKTEFDKLIKEIKDPIKKQQLIEKGKIIKKDIIEHINTYKRGDTK